MERPDITEALRRGITARIDPRKAATKAETTQLIETLKARGWKDPERFLQSLSGEPEGDPRPGWTRLRPEHLTWTSLHIRTYLDARRGERP